PPEPGLPEYLSISSQSFPQSTSWGICLSRASSAASLLSRPFSASSSFSRLASSAVTPLYFCPPPYSACSLVASRRRTWPAARPPATSTSASRSRRMICSTEDRDSITRPLPVRVTFTLFPGPPRLRLSARIRPCLRGPNHDEAAVHPGTDR